VRIRPFGHTCAPLDGALDVFLPPTNDGPFSTIAIAVAAQVELLGRDARTYRPSARPAAGRGVWPRIGRPGSRRSHAGRASAACRQCAGRTRGRATTCSRCARRRTRAGAPEFALAAFRAAFTGGVDLGRPESLTAVGRAVGIDPGELEAGAATTASRMPPRTCAACPP